MGDPLLIFFFLGISSFFINYFAWKKGFYHLTKSKVVYLNLHHVINIFTIYAFITLLLPFLMIQFHLFHLFDLWVRFLNIFILTSALWMYGHYCHDNLYKIVWKKPWSNSSYLSDIKIGILTWFLCFPLISLCGYLIHIFLLYQFGFTNYEQTAVIYLKRSLSSPSRLILALIWILLLAPVIEEFLFRGILQTYLKQKIGLKKAIIFSALFFALIHFSPQQQLGNLSLIPSLFLFACFLGFIYERQQSLFASISLHMTLNFVTSLRILLFSE